MRLLYEKDNYNGILKEVKKIAYLRIFCYHEKKQEVSGTDELFSYRDDTLYCHHTRTEHPDAEDFSLHAHPMCEIYYFLSGSGTYLVEGTQYELQPEDILIMRSAEAHHMLLHADIPYERAAIHFDPAILRGADPEGLLMKPFLDRALGHGNLYRAADFPTEHWRASFQDFDLMQASGPQARLHVYARLMSLLSDLYAAYCAREPAQPVAQAGSLAARIVDYLNRHLFEDLSLERVSRVFYLSKSQLGRIFRAATGSSVWEYVQIKRLLAARELLAQGQSAGKACAQCGFRDYSAFYRAYRARFGCSPREEADRAGTP